jgi:hypothetical protein
MKMGQIAAWFSQGWTPIYEAIREVFTIAIITLTPIWMGILLSLLLKEAPSFQFALRANTERGDLYLLATAMLAPLTLYISLRRGNLPRPFTIHFPGGWAFILSLALLFGASVFLFAVKRIADSPSASLRIDQEMFLLLSFVIYALSFALSLIVTCIKYILDSLTPDQTFREETVEFVDAWARRER